MSFADAEAALTEAMAEDFGGAPAPVPAPAPAEQAQPTQSATPQGTEVPQTGAPARDEHGRFKTADAPSTDSALDPFAENFNPDALPPELQAGFRQLQSAFTPRLQEAAALRKQLEELGGLDAVQQAVGLHRNLQDPGFLQEFHSELSKALEAQGLSPAQARAEAAREIESQTAQPSLSDQLARLKDDPEFAPVAATLQSLQSRLDAFEANEARRAEAEHMAQAQMALAGEIQRQEMTIRQSNPHYTDTDMDAIYELSAFHDGSLIEAQQRYEQIVSDRLERYLATKQAPVAASGPVAGSGTSEIPVAPSDLQEAYRAALGHLAEAGIDTLA